MLRISWGPWMSLWSSTLLADSDYGGDHGWFMIEFYNKKCMNIVKIKLGLLVVL